MLRNKARKVPKELAKSRETAKFVQEGAKKHKQFYNEVGLVEDPNKVIGSKKGKRSGLSKKKEKTSDFVRELEKKANKAPKKKFKFGKQMCDDLEYYIDKYGDNYEAMARDKLNIYQDSPGQIRYKVLKYKKIHKSVEN